MQWNARLLLVAAHPDDETVGAGGHFTDARDLWFVHATDGAPRNMQDARSHGFERREDYAEARRRELLSALRLAGIGEERAISLGFVDQETAFHMRELASRLCECIRKLAPAAILAPPYEGGHPDHDSVAFAVHAARRMLGDCPPIIGIRSTGTFGGAGASACPSVFPLSPAQCELKRHMLDCFATQRQTLAQFPVVHECFRPAPDDDFTAPPHPGPLFF
jgi:N-acetylglucosamine malate deacetylase 2